MGFFFLYNFSYMLAWVDLGLIEILPHVHKFTIKGIIVVSIIKILKTHTGERDGIIKNFD